MRIVIVSPMPPLRGGISEFSSRLAAQLSDMGNTVTAISFSLLYPGFLFPGKTQYNEGAKSPVPTAHTINSINPFTWFRTRRLIANENFDAALFAWWHPFFAPCIIGSLPRGIRTAAICHNVVPHDPFPFSSSLASQILKKAEIAIVHSNVDLKKARQVSDETSIIKLYHPIYDQYTRAAPSRESARKDLGYSSQERVVLFFGLVRPYKGLLDLINAMDQLDESTRLLIVGEPYGDASTYQSALSKQSAAGRAIWIDRFVCDNEVGKFFRTADAVALPYRHATQSGVGQIALSFGIPLVVTNVGGLPEMVEPGVTGFVAEAGEPASIAEAIRSALSISQSAQTKQLVLRKAGEFSWRGYAEALLESLR